MTLTESGLTALKQTAKEIANKLSCLNGLPIKVNMEYILNLQQIILFEFAEQFNEGKDRVVTDLPMLGKLQVDVVSNTDNNATNFEYKFIPHDKFADMVKSTFKSGKIDLPDILLDNYSKKIVSIYDNILDGE